MGEMEKFLKRTDSEVLPGLSESECLQSVQQCGAGIRKGQSKDAEGARAIHTLLSIQCKIEVAFPIQGESFYSFLFKQIG